MRLRLCLCTLATAAATMALSQELILGANDAVGLLPAEVVSGPVVSSIAWSSTGHHIAVVRNVQHLRPEMMGQAMTGHHEALAASKRLQELVIWSMPTEKGQTIVSLNADDSSVDQVQWMPQSEVLVFTTSRSSDTGGRVVSVQLVNASTQTNTVLGSVDAPAGAIVEVSPSRPLGAVIRAVASGSTASDAQPNTVINFFAATGKLLPEIDLPQKTIGPIWSADGLPYAESFDRQPKKKVVRHWFAIDPSSGKLTPASEPVRAFDALKAKTDVSLRQAAVSMHETGLPGDAHGAWIQVVGGKPAEGLLISTDATNPDLNPAGDAVAFTSQGAAMVRRLFRVPKEAYLEQLKQAQRSKAISNAKQTALALIMYSNDMDDNLPSSGSKWQDAIDPYLKNADISSGFTYTFAGGSTTGVPNPATTVLGYIDGPGGRAVAYLDGHVVWINN